MDLGYVIAADASAGDLLLRLHDVLAPMDPGALDPIMADRIEVVAAGVTAEPPPTDPAVPPVISEQFSTSYAASESVSVWVGDITRLGTDAVANAANQKMLGCRVPNHRCIDNAIHSAAGPRLRGDCRAIMEAQGSSELIIAGAGIPGYAAKILDMIAYVGFDTAGVTPVVDKGYRRRSFEPETQRHRITLTGPISNQKRLDWADDS